MRRGLLEGATPPRVSVVGSYGAGLTYGLARMPGRGETVLSLYHRVDHGGKGSNQAIAAARLGARSRLRTALGDDALAEQANRLWEEEGVDASVVTVAGTPTMTGVILVEPDGENRIVVAPGALAGLRPEHVVEDDVLGADVLLVQLEIPLDTAARALELAARHGVRSILDPAPAPDPSAPELASLLARADVLTPNVGEARALLGGGGSLDAPDLALALADRSAASVVLTAGSRGAFVVEAGRRTSVPAVAVPEVVDTTGAGDAFSAALAVALAEGADVVEGCRFAARAAAHAVTVAGVVPSLARREEMDRDDWNRDRRSGE
ncbi:MAG: PfkB family carbohydrate kinase [Actinomycetota bacterium]|nr:PfkB family carbohydrate kinase [Actinomycetota bacterium]